MSVIRWDPFKDLNALQERMNRLFEEANRGWPGADPSAATAWSPSVDIYETEAEIIVKAEIPGVEREAIELSLEDRLLTLKGERQFEKEAKDEKYHRIERSYGTFSRSFSIPTVVDEKRIRADYEEGVLTVTLPKTEKTKPKQIKINS